MQWFSFRATLLCLISFFACSSRVFGETGELYRFRSGIHFDRSHPFSNTQLKTLLHGLRFWTGLSEITFDQSGNLSLGNRSQVSGGSPAARNLLTAAVDSQDSFTLQKRDGSQTIAFAQIESIARYVDEAGGQHTVWEVRIDFDDFRELTAAQEVRASFDVAINILHELAHAVFGYIDLVDARDPLGECERYINQMRVEVGLPQRSYYYPNYRRVTRTDGWSIVQGELKFVAAAAGQGKEKNFLIIFNVQNVFDLSRAKSSDTIHANLVAHKNGVR
jgi:hypothetical protein